MYNEKIIDNNDSYFLEISKDYIIVNNDYEGIRVYDLEFNFQYNMIISKELFVYKSLGNSLSNNIVLYDNESNVVYFINLDTKKLNKFELEKNSIIYNHYFYETEDTIEIESNQYHIQFLKKTELVERQEKLLLPTFLSNYQDIFLTKDDCKLFLGTKSESSCLNIQYSEDMYYYNSKENVLCYNTNHLIVLDTYGNTNETIYTLKGESIRSARISKISVIILFDISTNSKQSRLSYFSI